MTGRYTIFGFAAVNGDKDLASFIDLIGEMGMYAMLRPGPYICSEWDEGGLPAWLCAKSVRRFREDDPVYMGYQSPTDDIASGGGARFRKGRLSH